MVGWVSGWGGGITVDASVHVRVRSCVCAQFIYNYSLLAQERAIQCQYCYSALCKHFFPFDHRIYRPKEEIMSAAPLEIVSGSYFNFHL
jgi:hypothetical protein